MGLQTWQEALFVNTVNGTAITGVSTEQLIFPDIVIPAGYMTLNKGLQQNCMGQVTFAGTPGTLTIRLRWGGIAGVVLATSAAVTGTASKTNITWTFYAQVVCRSVGATGTFMSHFEFNSAAIPAPNFFNGPASAPAVVTVDTTIVKNLSLTAQFSLTTGAMTGMTQILGAWN
jgi:hypothetical protein